MIFLKHGEPKSGGGVGPGGTQFVTVRELIDALERAGSVRLAAGKGNAGRRIVRGPVRTPGLALAMDESNVVPGEVLGLDTQSVRWLKGVGVGKGRAALERLFGEDVPCVLLAEADEPPGWVRVACARAKLPLIVAAGGFGEARQRADAFLDGQLATQTSVHGVLMDVFGVGVLIVGRSGIGKSECALDLVLRGHKLVADDIVYVRRTDAKVLVGASSDLILHHMEIQGLGIINIRELFGIAAVRERKRVDLVIELVEWRGDGVYDRLGIEERSRGILGIDVPAITLPVRPGRSMTTIVEVAARNHLLKRSGMHTARDFQRRLAREISRAKARLQQEGDAE
jgi:HPr kinase/phosphorylase